MIYSKYQEDIFNAILNTNSNIAIAASAGSGKTSTIVEAARRLSLRYPYKSILFNAFNNSIVEELKVRLPTTIECSTIHSLGMKALMRHFKANLIVNQFKTFKLADLVMSNIDLKGSKREIYKFIMSDIIDLMRMTLVEHESSLVDELCSRYDITLTGDEIAHSIELLQYLKQYNSKLRQGSMIDFTDMVYIPALSDEIKLKQYDVVFVDEIQDLNKIQHLFLLKLVKPGGRIIGVGDKSQAIYGFAGADINSFNLFESRENTIKLPLSICYRCAKDIVKNAQQINNEIEVYEEQEDGEVREGTIDEITSNDMVVCRNTRPLVALYFKLLDDDKKVFIKGHDIEKGLIMLYSKVKNLDKIDAKIKLKEKLETLEQELLGKGVKKPREHTKYLNLREKILILEIITNRSTYMNEVEKKIHDLFNDRKDAIELSTIHKAKGRESNRVFYIEKFNGNRLIPSKYAVKPWELTQENNILFVALTRAKKSLIYINLQE